MMTCINLMERFGDRYRIGWDEAYDPRSRPRDCLDPWMMTIPCRDGTIYPHGGTALAVECDRHPVAAKALDALSGCRKSQTGNGERTYLFDVADLDAVARIVKPRRRRVLSDAHRAALLAAGAANRFPSRVRPVQKSSDSHAEASA